MSKVCQYCGKTLSDEDRFCSGCGHEYVDAFEIEFDEAVPPYICPTEDTDHELLSKQKKHRIPKLVCICAAVWGMVGIAAFAANRIGNANSKNAAVVAESETKNETKVKETEVNKETKDIKETEKETTQKKTVQESQSTAKSETTRESQSQTQQTQQSQQSKAETESSVVETQAVNGTTADTGNYLLPQSTERYLTVEDLNGMTVQQVNYAKNEIYARHGRIFLSKELQSYFESKSWYKGTVSASAFTQDYAKQVFNAYELQNLQFLEAMEQKMQDGGYQLDQ